MSASIPPDLADHDHDRELTRLLHDRAGAVHPRGTTPALLARRAGRVRHRRRATVAGIGLAATAVVASVVVTRPSSSDDSQRVETGIADTAVDGDADAGPGVSTVPTDDAPGTTAPVHTIPIGVAALASGPPPRLGLGPDVAGATVSSVVDFPDAETRDPRIGMTMSQLYEGSNGRTITVLVTFPPEGGLADDPVPYVAAGDVDLGDGVMASINRTTPVGGYSSNTIVTFDEDGLRMSVLGAGASDEELLEVARGIETHRSEVVDELKVNWLPDDMTLADWFDPPAMGSTPIRSAVSYDLADGQQVDISVSSRADEMFEHELEQARTEPDPAISRVLPSPQITSIRTVRGVEAVVRAGPVQTQISWVEPSGHLVRMFISSPDDPTNVPDPSLVDSVVELDEATFQSLLAEHPGG